MKSPFGTTLLAIALLGPRARADDSSVLPILTEVSVEVSPEYALVEQQFALELSDLGRDVHVFVAFGSPGLPQALRADVVYEGTAGPVTEKVSWEQRPTCPRRAVVLVGPAKMAGAVLEVKADLLRRATRLRSRPIVRLRAVHALPPADTSGMRELLVRVGENGHEPPALWKIDVRGAHPKAFVVMKAEASFCGPSAEEKPLFLPRTPKRDALSPLLAPRHAGDRLCVRFIAAEPSPPASRDPAPRPQ